MNDQEYVNQIRSLRCFACGSSPPSEAHHVYSRGAAGKPIDAYWNLIPLCTEHHTMGRYSWHRGRLTFLEKFPHVWEHLVKLGWERNGNKLFHPEMLNGRT